MHDDLKSAFDKSEKFTVAAFRKVRSLMFSDCTFGLERCKDETSWQGWIRFPDGKSRSRKIENCTAGMFYEWLEKEYRDWLIGQGDAPQTQ